ncbi:hypothetical protein BURCE16_12805 [Burkholderia cepacia]|nr:hypothetical protein BURCE16_12805 [Burkholderia cepacia]
MSTYPFVSVEGALTFPTIHPITCLPSAWGCEWTLAAPRLSRHGERMGYAAIMYTVCMSADAIRAAARWDRFRSPVQQRSAPVAGSVLPAYVNCTASGKHGVARGQHTPASRPRAELSFERSKLIGGTIAIFGTALLAWIIGSHTPSDTFVAARFSRQSFGSGTPQDVPKHLVDAHTQHGRVIRSDAHSTTARTSAPSNARISSFPRAGAGKVIETLRSTVVSEPIPSIAGFPQSASRSERESPQVYLRERTRPDFDASARREAQAASTIGVWQRKTGADDGVLKGDMSQHRAARDASQPDDADGFAVGPETFWTTAERSGATYSEAKIDSSHEMGAKPAVTFTSILPDARNCQAARASEPLSAPVESTDWSNHITHRRITEISGIFMKELTESRGADLAETPPCIFGGQCGSDTTPTDRGAG